MLKYWPLTTHTVCDISARSVGGEMLDVYRLKFLRWVTHTRPHIRTFFLNTIFQYFATYWTHFHKNPDLVHNSKALCMRKQNYKRIKKKKQKTMASDDVEDEGSLLARTAGSAILVRCRVPSCSLEMSEYTAPARYCSIARSLDREGSCSASVFILFY